MLETADGYRRQEVSKKTHFVNLVSQPVGRKREKMEFIQPSDDNQSQMHWEKNAYECKASVK